MSKPSLSDAQEAMTPDEEELHFPLIHVRRPGENTPAPNYYRTLIAHPKRRSSAPVKGHRSPNSIKTKTSDANQVNALDPEGSQRG